MLTRARALLMCSGIALVAAAGCRGEEPAIGSRQDNMGLDWGGYGWGPTDSDLPDPTVRFLYEYRTDQMRSALRVAVSPAGTIAVTDPDARLVHVLGPHGDRRLALSVARPLGVAIDGDENIYVGDEQTGAVLIFDGAGESRGFLGDGPGEFVQPTELLWVPSEGTIHVADSGNDKIFVYATAGALLFEYGHSGTGPAGFHFPNGLSLDAAAGRIYVTDHSNARVQVFDLGGTYQSAFGSYGSSKKQFNRPGGSAVDGMGRVYVPDAYQSSVQVVDGEGLHVSYLGEAGSLRGQLRLTTDAALDPWNRLIVTSHFNGKLLVYGIDDYSEPPDPMLAATVVVDPGTLTTRTRARWITAVIEVPDDDAANLRADTLRLQGNVADLTAPVVLGDADSDGIPDLSVKFSWSALQAVLPGTGTHALTLTGELTSGQLVEGTASFVYLEAGGGS